MIADEVTRGEIVEALRALRKAVSERSLRGALDLFMRDDDVLMIGSEAGETARGQRELEDFFRRAFERPVRYSWEWPDISVSAAGPVAWIYADGEAVVSGPDGEYRNPYRLTGILESTPLGWRWRVFHGSEPA